MNLFGQSHFPISIPGWITWDNNRLVLSPEGKSETRSLPSLSFSCWAALSGIIGFRGKEESIPRGLDGRGGTPLTIPDRWLTIFILLLAKFWKVGMITSEKVDYSTNGEIVILWVEYTVESSHQMFPSWNSNCGFRKATVYSYWPLMSTWGHAMNCTGRCFPACCPVHAGTGSSTPCYDPEWDYACGEKNGRMNVSSNVVNLYFEIN